MPYSFAQHECLGSRFITGICGVFLDAVRLPLGSCGLSGMVHGVAGLPATRNGALVHACGKRRRYRQRESGTYIPVHVFLCMCLGIGEGGVSWCVWCVGGITCPELQRSRCT